jgi:hypothetical protein
MVGEAGRPCLEREPRKLGMSLYEKYSLQSISCEANTSVDPRDYQGVYKIGFLRKEKRPDISNLTPEVVCREPRPVAVILSSEGPGLVGYSSREAEDEERITETLGAEDMQNVPLE